jgi:hypothetical protein
LLDGERAGNRLHHSLDGGGRVLGVLGVGQHDGELVTAQPTDHVGFSDRGSQAA